MYVIKRDGSKVPVRYDSITDRNIEYGKDLDVDVTHLSQLVINSLKSGMTTSDIDMLSSETAFYQSCYEPDYDILATRIAISNLHKSTSSSFVETIKKLQHQTNKHTGKLITTLSNEFVAYVEKHADRIEQAIDYSRDYKYNFFGLKTLQKLYLLKLDEKCIERPQHMLMRVSIAIHMDMKDDSSIDAVIETYDALSNHLFTHASPTLFNAGNPTGNLSSCFLLDMSDDLSHIFETNKRCALISKLGGGIGINVSKIRSKGSVIHSSNGKSDGLVPMIKCFNATANYSNQCFTPETKIVTADGCKDICSITTQDKVLTSDGSFKQVLAIHCNKIEEEEILSIRTTYSFEPIRVTATHEMFVIPEIPRHTNSDVIKNRLDKNIKQPVYMPAKDLTTDDFVAFPQSHGIDQNMSPELTADLCRMYGMMLGDGHIYLRKENRNTGECGITINNSSKAHLENVIRSFLNDRGINFWISTDEVKSTISIRWTYNPTKHCITYEDLYDEHHEKRIHPRFFKLDKERTFQIIKGLLETDGSVGKEIYFITTSRELAYGLRFLLLKCNILSSGNIRDEVGKTREIRPGKFITNRKIAYTIRIPKDKDLIQVLEKDMTSYHLKYFSHDNKLWSRILSIDHEVYSGLTYDLTVESNHNYVVSSFGIVHNSGRRAGSFAMYLEPSHPDVMEFLALRLPTPPEELRARDIFLAMWISDLFMERVESNGMWSLFCPNKVPLLNETYGDEYRKIYLEAEEKKLYNKQVPAQDIWKAILQSQQETGLPYISYKDHINRKSMQQNLGIVRSSNLCNEIVEVTTPDSVAVCNLASVALHKFVVFNENKVPTYDYEGLGKIVKMAVRNLNKVIDRTHYPVAEAKGNNLDYRPIGLGVQGLADTFALFKCAWGSETSKMLNRTIFETIYYYALEASHELAMRDGSYAGFEGSPIREGKLHYHLWETEPLTATSSTNPLIPHLDWNGLVEKCKKGVRNSLLVALMPTASSSQILGSNEAFEAFTSNIYTRSTNSGEFIVVNKHLYRDLKELGLWNRQLVDTMIRENGSVQDIQAIPQDIKDRYKTVWELSQKIIIDMAADRAPFVDQTQSMNIFIARPSHAALSSMHLYGWKKGLKTGSYYIRSKPARDAVKFTLSSSSNTTTTLPPKSKFVCVGEEGCLSCSS